jgi:hypothetical protein
VRTRIPAKFQFPADNVKCDARFTVRWNDCRRSRVHPPNGSPGRCGIRKIALIIAATLAADTVAAAAPGGKGHGWKAVGGNPPGFSHGRKLGWGSAG